MSTDYLRYDRMIEAALRYVVRHSLMDASKQGLLGDHHFYISFETNAPGVVIPKPLRAKYPEEMTIVLQHQFQNLKIEDDFFSVTLSFGGVPSNLTIPFTAITSFADPSVNFALQFQTLDGSEEGEESENSNEKGQKGKGEHSKKKDEKSGDSPPMGQVISLDSFRKK